LRKMSFLVVVLVVFIIYAIVALTARMFLRDGGMCTYEPDLHGRVYVATGTTRGLGLITAKRIASHGATLVMLNRSETAGKEVAASITAETGNENVFNVVCNLADLASVKAASEEVLSKWPEIDALLCNAGTLTTTLVSTVQGFEHNYGVNFLSHYVLFNNLLPALQKRPEARVIMMSSCGQWLTTGLDFNLLTYDDYSSHWYRYMSAYCRSKLAMLIFSKECQRRYGSDRFVSVSAAPGVVYTDLWRDSSMFHFLLSSFIRPVTNTVLEGAQTEITCCLAPFETLVPGAYYDQRQPSWVHPQAKNEAVGAELWKIAFSQAHEFMLNPDLADPSKQQ